MEPPAEVEIIVQNKDKEGSRHSSNESLQGLSQSECPICLSDDAENVLIRFPDCKHIFCQNCLKEYLMTQINNFKVLKIKCPQDGCSIVLQESIIKQILDEEAFQRYQTLLLQKLKNRGQKPQICPKSGCAKKFSATKDSPYTKCSCGTMICNLCGDFYHEGKNCLQAMDPEFEIYAKENNLKFCVMCKTVINRVEGCLHISCPVCDYEWCWLCGREYKFQHQLKCPKKWDPLPPMRILRENEVKYWWTEIARFFKALAIFLITLPGKILLWPFWIFNIWLEIKMRHFTKAQKCQKVAAGLLSSVAYTGLLVLIVFMAASADNMGARIVFFICMGILIPAPWCARLITLANNYFARRNRRQRWLTRDANAFGYTDAHRPQENNQNTANAANANNPEAQAQVQVQVQTEDGNGNKDVIVVEERIKNHQVEGFPIIERKPSFEVIVHNHPQEEHEKSFERVLPQEPEQEEEGDSSEDSEIPLPEIEGMSDDGAEDKNKEFDGDREERRSILEREPSMRKHTSNCEVSNHEIRINIMEIQRVV